jgi:hypothetical protein
MQLPLGSGTASTRSTYWLAVGLIGLVFVVSSAPSPVAAILAQGGSRFGAAFGPLPVGDSADALCAVESEAP